ncbi:hypothetical protein AAFF_G00049920 [Aldrovandia affinis]|uniref:Uncharacterized protein n=1 Tax=Aldrovandia affinis TaxID=143900 RepID=A0AAD7S1D5_9TELE|nr:hypothetical protein AAFF_G00049920 [Aldrovandia affinis]
MGRSLTPRGATRDISNRWGGLENGASVLESPRPPCPNERQTPAGSATAGQTKTARRTTVRYQSAEGLQGPVGGCSPASLKGSWRWCRDRARERKPVHWDSESGHSRRERAFSPVENLTSYGWLSHAPRYGRDAHAHYLLG